MRFRRRADEMFDGLSDRDAARLKAMLEQAVAVPGLVAVQKPIKVAPEGGSLQPPSALMSRKRGRRA